MQMPVTVNCSSAQLHEASRTEFVSQSAKFVICPVCKPTLTSRGLQKFLLHFCANHFWYVLDL